MGDCLTKLQENDDKENEDPAQYGDDLEFDESQRNRSRLAGGVGHQGDGAGERLRRRKSSGLSKYSQDGLHVVNKPICIGAFNVQRFGTAKLKDKATLEILVRIVREFDILLVQEVVDASGQAIEQLLEEVNKVNDNEGNYDVLASPRVGRSSQKEQYAVFYKTSLVKIKASQIYHDPGDVFIREPFLVDVCIDIVTPEAQEFSLICIHTQPKSANVEIDRLVDVQQYVKDLWQTDNIVILGDLNASGPYLKTRDWETNRLRGPTFQWLIPDHIDTTATNTLAAYDRIIALGPICDQVVTNSAKVFRYDDVYGIEKDSLLKVSDHYPVCFSLETTAHAQVRKNITSTITISFQDKRFINSSPQAFVQNFNLKRFRVGQFYSEDGKVERVEVKSHKMSKCSDALASLESLRNHDHSLVSYSSLSSLKHQVNTVMDSWDAKLLQEQKRKFQVIVLLDIHQQVVVTSLVISL
eukprot:TRINITY_DN4655_c0_g1_i1.p1 TRINITY_DN4655_c0_g1~~TRINITY_DN4655_c0_g1_i1.p1  ORF type:complete len:469 (-),score=97.58 TRINITY_DN4655_c0_g1_i1:130-1536(-)